MRTDALRNRQRLLDAAVEHILAVGAQPSLDAIARQAGVGIGTLYRHFPDREALLKAVALHVLEHAIKAARSALDEAPTGYDALRQYMHAAFDHGVGVLNILYPALESPDWSAQRDAMRPLLEALLRRCKRERSTRRDLRAADLVIALIRFSRPVAIGMPPDEERALARRHLDIYIDGLAAPAAETGARSTDRAGVRPSGPPAVLQHAQRKRRRRPRGGVRGRRA
jgi:AcrR family transcriptional regulator